MSKILISMPEDFLAHVDLVAANEQRTRSELIREALRNYMKRANMQNYEKAQNTAEMLEDLIG